MFNAKPSAFDIIDLFVRARKKKKNDHRKNVL